MDSHGNQTTDGEDKATLEKSNGRESLPSLQFLMNSKVELSLTIYFHLYIDRGNPIGRHCHQGKMLQHSSGLSWGPQHRPEEARHHLGSQLDCCCYWKKLLWGLELSGSVSIVFLRSGRFLPVIDPIWWRINLCYWIIQFQVWSQSEITNAHAQKEKSRMTPSPSCSSKLPSSNHTRERQQNIKDGLVAIDNTHKNDPHALVWNLPGWN